MTSRQQTRTAHLLLLAVVLIWGTTFTLVKAALADASPLLFNLLRMSLAFIVLAAINVRTLRSATRRDLAYGTIAGIFLGLGYQFQTTGLALTTASKSAFITGLVVVIVPILSLIPGARPTAMLAPRWSGFAGALIAFSGLVLLTTPPGSGSALFSGIGLGEALTLACAVAFAAHLLTLGHAARITSARTLGTVQIGVATILMLLTLPLGGRPILHLTPRLLLALAITSILATAAAFTIQSWAQQHLSPTHTALIFTLEPVFAWLTSLLFLHDRLGGRALSGAGLILSGILVTELWPAASPHSLHPTSEEIGGGDINAH
jgi:drug/metabolite transporter (DMT)-like permease